MTKRSEQPRQAMSERLRFVLSGMSHATDTNEELNVALNWLYFALIFAMEDPMAAAALLLELEDQDGWTDEYRQITRDNVRLALDHAGRFFMTKEATA